MPVEAPKLVAYTPNGKQEFVFNKISKKLHKNGYKYVCFDRPQPHTITNCLRNKLNYHRYVGKKGYFTNEPEVNNGSYSVKEAVLETGEKLYLFTPESRGVNSRYIVSLKQFNKEKSFQPTDIVEGANVKITGYDESGMGRLNVSSQANHSFSESEIEIMRNISRHFPKNQGQIADLLSTLTIKYDDFSRTTLIYSPRYHNKTSSFGIHIKAHNNLNFDARLIARYESTKWLFIDSFSVAADNYRWHSAKNLNFNRDNGSGKIWEWLSVNINKSNIVMLKELSASNNSKIRFHGKQYFDDYTLTKEQKSDLGNLIKLVELMNIK